MSIVVPVLVVLCFGALFIHLALLQTEATERRRLVVVVYAAFLLRLGLAIVFQLVPSLRVTHDDASGYEENAMIVAMSWKGFGPRVTTTLSGMLNGGYLYVGAVLCYLFGVYPLQLSAWNTLFGTLTVIFLYRLARHLFHSQVALRAATLLAFMPSMIVWNSVAIKDPIMVFLVTVSIYLYVRLRQRWSTMLAISLALAVLSTFFIRFYISYFLILSIMLTVFVGRARQGTSPLRSLFVVVAFAIVIGVTGMSRDLSQGLEMANLEHMANYRVGMATTANSGFAHDLDIKSPRGALMALPLGLAVVLFGPFPWQMRSLLPLATLPEMLFWWSLVPSLFRGLRFAFRQNFARSSPIFVFCVSLTIAYSLTLGNVGAAVRQRAQIFVFLFVFVALGQFVSFCRKNRVDTRLLIRQPERVE